ncbi:hypothetical protein D3C74_462250 [compost metagenome]
MSNRLSSLKLTLRASVISQSAVMARLNQPALARQASWRLVRLLPQLGTLSMAAA